MTYLCGTRQRTGLAGRRDVAQVVRDQDGRPKRFAFRWLPPVFGLPFSTEEAALTDTIAIGALVHRGRLLLAHRHPNRRWYPDCWDLVGGHVEPGESPEQAVDRECLEEIAVEVLERQRVVVDLADPNLVPYAFLVTRWRGQPMNAAKDEHDALGWFAASELPKLRLAHPSYAEWFPTLIDIAADSAGCSG